MTGTTDDAPVTTRHEIRVAKYDDSGERLLETVSLTVEDDGQGGQRLIESRTDPADKEQDRGED